MKIALQKISPYLVGMAVAILLVVGGCNSPKLAPGGAYSGSTLTTNAAGVVTTNTISASEPELFIADSAYKLAYDTVDGILLFEFNNRVALLVQFPALKPSLDKVRPVILDVDRRWAAARQAYKANPTPAGLSTINTILAEIQKLIPTAQAAIAPVYASSTK